MSATPLITLQDWLAHCERIHPKQIDMGLERARAVAERLNLHFECPVITVAGTNGKGSTCAMIEAVALQAGYRTGVYTSPHLVHFEERCRIHGESVNASELIANFEAVESARCQNGQEISLSYFEFTTLAILRLMSDTGDPSRQSEGERDEQRDQLEAPFRGVRRTPRMIRVVRGRPS